jgi:hypothetical protein
VTSTAHEAVTLEGTSSTEAATTSMPTQWRDDEGDLHFDGGTSILLRHRFERSAKKNGAKCFAPAEFIGSGSRICSLFLS